jgi:hypothetical protein
MTDTASTMEAREVTAMADISIDGTKLTGVLRLTWMTDQLAHVLDHSQTDEPTGTFSAPTTGSRSALMWITPSCNA